MPEEALLDERALSKLQWRCRRGLLENDLFIERFFGRFAATLTTRQASALEALMELGDNDLLDLQLGRKSLHQVDASLETEAVCEVLTMLREPLGKANHETS
ncbi:MAG: succinate dehydrogenase assembly factor 2 [Rhodoferax sp.]|nr:succinate dehydrogenase assembly factor 2 [Rhodoferax sp.]